MRIIKSLAFLAAGGLAAVGCGSDTTTTCPDGGCPADATAMTSGSDGPALFFLSRGMLDYKVTKIEAVTDDPKMGGCDKGPDAVVNSTLPVNSTYNDATGVFTMEVGKKVGTPPMPSIGTGTIKNNAGTLMRENDSGDGAGCTWHEKVSGLVNVFAGDKFTIAVTDDMSNFDKACKAADVPMGGKCTSKWTWTLEK
jgi:hypothetical protein